MAKDSVFKVQLKNVLFLKIIERINKNSKVESEYLLCLRIK